jgi:hypothetical protein
VTRLYLETPRLADMCQVYLIDNNSKVAHQWDLPHRVGRHARLLPNGNLAVGMKDPNAPAPFLFVSPSAGLVCSE